MGINECWPDPAAYSGEAKKEVTAYYRRSLAKMLRDLHRWGEKNRGITNSIYKLVLDYGWWYEAISLPKGVRQRKKKECYFNASQLAFDRDQFTYVEGFAFSKGLAFPIQHAWVTDGMGQAIDTTWEPPSVVYAGIPFKTQQVARIMAREEASVPMLNERMYDHINGVDISDYSKSWCESRGNGMSPVSKPRSARRSPLSRSNRR